MKADGGPFQFDSPEAVMRRAIELARRGLGRVEPNPAVGAVVVDANLKRLAEGYHERFGADHAEVAALKACPRLPPDATLFVTLEPCCHYGKTPPCTEAIVRSGVRRVVVAALDPSPHANGQGVARLREAGVTVEVGLLEDEVRKLNAPFFKLVTTGLPYVHAKWAMTLDGKLAARTGASKWISNERSRRLVHQLRGRVDAVAVGIGTALTDDPELTARPPGPRQAVRVVFDSRARLPGESRLLKTARQWPVLVVVGRSASTAAVQRLRDAGAEVLVVDSQVTPTGQELLDLRQALAEFGRRKMTNVLVEGGAKLLGSLFDAQLIDEVHVFVGPKLVGGARAVSPLAGEGLDDVRRAARVDDLEVQLLDGDVYLRGRLVWPERDGADEGRDRTNA